MLRSCAPSAEAAAPPDSPTVLIVEPDAAYRELLFDAANAYAVSEGVADFRSAFARLASDAPDLLVTNLRLRTNIEGLQLAYTVASARYATRAVVYSEHREPWIVHQIQRAGAFYEHPARLVFALPAYVRSKLPVRDRRNPQTPDRRTSYRGGRRRSDVSLISPRI